MEGKLGGEIASKLNQIEQAAHYLRAMWMVKGTLDLMDVQQIELWAEEIKQEFVRTHPNRVGT